MPALADDLRYAVRQLRKAPGFTLTVILTLALGIGALTTVATWTNAVLFNPWPGVENPSSLRFVSATVLGSNGYSVHYDQVQYMRSQGRSFSDAAAFALEMLDLNASGAQPQAIVADLAQSNYFQVLGLKPQAGRFFVPSGSDRAYGSSDEIVLSDGLWRRAFNADPEIVGRVVTVNGHAFTVIGVAPRNFQGIFGGIAESAWLPLSSLRDLSSDPEPDPLSHYGLQVVLRLRPGVAGSTAAAEVHTIARNFIASQHSDKYNGWDLNLDDAAHFQRGLFGLVGQQLPVLFGASILLMVLVCINIASLLGQHAARRRREIAIRTSLGASPGRIAAQMFVETALLACAGALAGWGASLGFSRALYILLPNFGLPLAFNLQSDRLILLFVTAVAIVVTLVCGMHPVRQSLRASQKEALHTGGAAVTGARRGKLGRMILGLQLGICFIVLVCCGLLTRTALNIFSRNIGFDRANVVTANIALARSGYNEARGLAFQAALLNRLRSAAGVSGATFTSHLPMGDNGSGNTWDFSIPGYAPARGEEMSVVTDLEGPDFFHTMRIAVQQGREFTTQDSASAPLVAMVSRAFASRYWPHGDAIGHSIVVNGKPRQIVGIVGDYTYHSPDNTESEQLLFLPLAQNYQGYVTVAVRAQSTDLAAVQLRQAIAALDSALPLEDLSTLEQVSGQQYQFSRIPAELLSVYSFSSVLVAMLGLYAVMAYSVTERHREFALRMALGSTRGGIFRLVLSGTSTVAVIGLVTGGLGCIAAVRLLRSMLFGVAAFDPLSYCAAAMLLLLTVFLSGLGPARRAATIEPMQALRTE